MKFSRETGSACNTTCRACGEHHPCPQNKGQGQTPGSPTAQVNQVGIKIAPRQIPTAGETGWRGPIKEKTWIWLKAVSLKAETKGFIFIIAAQDQSLSTRWYQHNTLKKPDVDPEWRLCGRFDETIDHLGRVIRRQVKSKPGLFFFASKAFSRKIFPILFRVPNHQIVDKNN